MTKEKDVTVTTDVKPESAPNGREARRNRIRFAGPRLRLQVDEELKDKNFFYRFFNDDKGELGQAQRAGYVYVTKKEMGEVDSLGDKEVHGGNTDLNSYVSRVVGRNAANQPLRAYLMKLPRDLYDEDQEWREANVNAAVDESLRRGTPQGHQVQNSYGTRVSIKKGQ
jgi:hypothetical protein